MFDNIKYLFLVNVFMVFATFAGNGLRIFFNVDFKEKKDINLCISFFFGIIGIIFLFRTIGYFVDLKYAKYLTIMIMIFIIIKYNRINLIFSKELRKNFWIYVLSFCSLMILLPLYWHPINNDINDNLSHIGSLHSVKYAWISNFIFICNYIPVLGQNTGQSLYVSFLTLLFGAKPFLYLSTLLIWSQFILFILVFGVFKIFFDCYRSLAYSLLIFLGTSSLSLTHILVIDSGSPLLLNGYADTLIGIFSIFIFYHLYNYINDWKVKDFILFGIVLLVNFLSAPQNILFILVINFLISIIGYKNKIFLKKILIINLFTLLISFCGIFLGGMLTPSFLQTNFVFNFLQTLFSKSSSIGYGFNIIPGIPFYYGSMSEGWVFGNMDLLKQGQSLISEPSLKLSNLIWILESIFFNSIRVLTVPFIGYVFVVFHLNLSKLNFSANNNYFYKFCFFTFLLFSIGFIICFFISFNGYKWEFSRFLIPGYLLSYIAFCIFLESFVKAFNISNYLFCIIIFLLVIGPICDFFITILNNLNDVISNYNSLNNFWGSGPFIDKSYCSVN